MPVSAEACHRVVLNVFCGLSPVEEVGGTAARWSRPRADVWPTAGKCQVRPCNGSCITEDRAIMPTMMEKLKRRLTTVLCADASGYTRLMEADEAGTLATLRRYRTAMAALIERHDGRIVNTWGDAVIAEFASVVEAVQCAIETQQELSTRDPHLPEAQPMRFRIGINLGDVMVDAVSYWPRQTISVVLARRSNPMIFSRMNASCLCVAGGF